MMREIFNRYETSRLVQTHLRRWGLCDVCISVFTSRLLYLYPWSFSCFFCLCFGDVMFTVVLLGGVSVQIVLVAVNLFGIHTY